MKLLAVIDMQNDFIDGALGTKEAEGIVENVKARIDAARKDGWTVVFTRDTHLENYMQTQEGKKLPVPHCIKGTFGWQIKEGLAAEGEMILDKPTFGSERLAEYAKAQDPDQIELIGICTDICVISNAMLLKAALPETPIAVRKDCCAGVTPASHDNALSAMQMCQIDVI